MCGGVTGASFSFWLSSYVYSADDGDENVRDTSLMAIRTIGALLFVALFALFLAQPVLDSGDDRPARLPTVEVSATPDGQAVKVLPSETKTARRLVNGYPRACLRQVQPPSGAGLVAAFDARGVTIVSTNGDVQATIEDVAPTVRPPIAWSPSGRVLAVGPQGLFWTPEGARVPIGDVQHGMVVGARGRWGWSPIADCGAHIDANGELLITAVDPGTSTKGGLAVGAGIALVRPAVESFSFSPDGRSLGLVIVDGRRREIWVADLERNNMAAVTRFPSSTCCVTLGGWTPDGAELLFWAASGASVSADGWLLQSVDPKNRRISSFTAVRVRPEFLERCAGALLGIVGGDRFDVGPMRLAELQAGAAPRYLTPASESHFRFSCTANGALIATPRGELRDGSDPVGSTSRTEVTILRADGSEVITLTPAGMSDAAPEWGPPGTGLIFVRLSDGAATVLFAAEGRTPTALGVSVSIPRPDSAWHQVLDWSVTPPDGLPAG